MAARNGISLPSPMYTTIEALEERYKNFANLDDFLNYFVRPHAPAGLDRSRDGTPPRATAPDASAQC